MAEDSDAEDSDAGDSDAGDSDAGDSDAEERGPPSSAAAAGATANARPIPAATDPACSHRTTGSCELFERRVTCCSIRGFQPGSQGANRVLRV
ncbi:MAG: hypothetical protein WD228_11800 [Mycobacterium sp.]